MFILKALWMGRVSLIRPNLSNTKQQRPTVKGYEALYSYSYQYPFDLFCGSYYRLTLI